MQSSCDGVWACAGGRAAYIGPWRLGMVSREGVDLLQERKGRRMLAGGGRFKER